MHPLTRIASISAASTLAIFLGGCENDCGGRFPLAQVEEADHQEVKVSPETKRKLEEQFRNYKPQKTPEALTPAEKCKQLMGYEEPDSRATGAFLAFCIIAVLAIFYNARTKRLTGMNFIKWHLQKKRQR